MRKAAHFRTKYIRWNNPPSRKFWDKHFIFHKPKWCFLRSPPPWKYSLRQKLTAEINSHALFHTNAGLNTLTSLIETQMWRVLNFFPFREGKWCWHLSPTSEGRLRRKGRSGRHGSCWALNTKRELFCLCFAGKKTWQRHKFALRGCRSVASNIKNPLCLAPEYRKSFLPKFAKLFYNVFNVNKIEFSIHPFSN